MTYFVAYTPLAIYGIGQTTNEALQEAEKWTEGDMIGVKVAECTKRLYDSVKQGWNVDMFCDNRNDGIMDIYAKGE